MWKSMLRFHSWIFSSNTKIEFTYIIQANMINSTLHGETHVLNLLSEEFGFPMTIILSITQEVNV